MGLINAARAGQPPKRNDRWEYLEKTQHARTQSEMVDSIVLERNKGRKGLKTQELGNQHKKLADGTLVPDNSPAAQMNKMTYEELQGFFINVLKSHAVIQRLEAYKDDALLDDEVFEKRVTTETVALTSTIYKQLIYLSDRIALELCKESVAGVDVNAQGELWIYHWKPDGEDSLSATLQGGRGAKKPKSKDKDEDSAKDSKEPSPVVRVHYLIS